MSDDPFRYHPELRDKIVKPDDSWFRNFTTARLESQLDEMGLETGWWRSDDDREATRHAALAGRWEQDLWVFAYGSLMWDPGFRFTEVRRAHAPLHERRFILRDTRGGRGTPEVPGLMAALDEGHGCDGLLLRLAAATLDEETTILWRREMIAPAYQPCFIPVEVEKRRLKALTFVADHDADIIAADLTRSEQVACIASGTGILGSSLEYLRNTCAQCVALGIHDDRMNALLADAEAHGDANATKLQ